MAKNGGAAARRFAVSDTEMCLRATPLGVAACRFAVSDTAIPPSPIPSRGAAARRFAVSDTSHSFHGYLACVRLPVDLRFATPELGQDRAAARVRLRVDLRFLTPAQ